MGNQLMSGRKTGKNLLRMYPKRNARWKSVKEDTLKKLAEKENRGAVVKGGTVRDKFIQDAKVVLYGQKKLNKIEHVIADLINAPKDSRVWLDEYGAFVWKRCDGRTSVKDIGEALKEEFGDTEQVYPRLSKFLYDLESNGLVRMLESKEKRKRGGKKGSKKSSS